MKKLSMAATVVGLGAVSSFAELKVNDNLSMSGFVDASVVGVTDDVDATDDALNAALDQVELDFMWKFGDKVSARADVNAWVTAPGGAGDAVLVEQGFVTATLGALSISGGRFLSSTGFEAAEPTGLYQYSWSNNLYYGGYQNGVNLNYAAGMVNLYGALITSGWRSGETDLTTPAFEAQVGVTPVTGLTAKVAYLHEMIDTTGHDMQQLVNAWAQFQTGSLTAAAEFNYLMNWGDDDVNGMGYLVMANMKFGPIFALTLRHSANIIDEADPVMEITVSPSLTLSPNWLLLAENRYQIDPMVNQYAIESLFSF